jgi:hypothetical protein
MPQLFDTGAANAEWVLAPIAVDHDMTPVLSEEAVKRAFASA